MHTGGAADNTSLLIYRLQKLPNDKRYTLDPFDLFLCSKQLAPQVVGFIEDVLLRGRMDQSCDIRINHSTNLLQSQEFPMCLEFLPLGIQLFVARWQGVEQCLLLADFCLKRGLLCCGDKTRSVKAHKKNRLASGKHYLPPS